MAIEREHVETDELTPAEAQALLDEALADLAAGRTVSHDQVVAWARRRAAGERIALPEFDGRSCPQT
jgi:predicted transcriptional regulator